jgi:hypothetical protein
MHERFGRAELFDRLPLSFCGVHADVEVGGDCIVQVVADLR